MAVALDWGLIVPVIKNADEKSILGLARATQDLAERARDEAAEARGDPGRHLHRSRTPASSAPSSARRSSRSRRSRSSGVGTIEKRPVVVTDEDGSDALGIRTIGYLALSFDHRLIDGADADKFMASLKTTLESGEFDLG